MDESSLEDYRSVQQSPGYAKAEPRPSQEYLTDYYAREFYQAPSSPSYALQYSNEELGYRERRARLLVHALQKCCAPTSLLDCGAGEGFVMDAADKAGIDVTGIDYSAFGIESWHPTLASALRVGDIDEVLDDMARRDAKFDACTMVNVLEHVIDPSATLARVRDVMSPRGVIAVTVPNDYSDLQQLLLDSSMVNHEYWFSPPVHLSYWNVSGICRYLESQGFSVVDGFSDFPIEVFLLHPASNYYDQRESNGPPAHVARRLYDGLIAEQGWDSYLDFYRSLFRVGQGRNVTVLFRSREVEGFPAV